jgi:hypothetical protein
MKGVIVNKESNYSLNVFDNYKKELNARARRILEFDSYTINEFDISGETMKDATENDPWS